MAFALMQRSVSVGVMHVHECGGNMFSTDMAVGDISNILSRLNKQGQNLYITQEVVYGGGQPVTPNQYTQTGDVQECVSPWHRGAH